MALQEEMEVQGNWLFTRRGTLPLVILVVGVVTFILHGSNSNHYFTYHPLVEIYYQSSCFLVSLIGLAIRIYTVGFTPRNTSGRNTGAQLADCLNTKGIYSIVRHPLYLGNFFMWLGVAMLTEIFWFIIAFIFLYWLYYERIMYAEEQYLRKKFGSTYTDWAAITPAVIPKFRQFNSSNLTFSWKKVLRNEKNGLVALFILFMIFDLLRLWIRDDSHLNMFFIAGTLISGILYLVLKYLKHKTRVLHEDGR
jgi:protein-S-isoprenylcysteine O-methyltransferase Ste14